MTSHMDTPAIVGNYRQNFRLIRHISGQRQSERSLRINKGTSNISQKTPTSAPSIVNCTAIRQCNPAEITRIPKNIKCTSKNGIGEEVYKTSLIGCGTSKRCL
ncbi:hypothetical protein CRM22_001658 [Opisthorchis felineus]|uniref:Uncharacterized protein n=1 Tax=Opisthorchis felineus TaxID=147828 RepID=A0A4S2M9L6_OPIFE|nr:hypothetical protein CRM22_001658 [Opisthorchis felineus]